MSTVHVGESPEEIEFLKKGTGPWRTLLEELGVWNSLAGTAVVPGGALSDIGFLDATVIAARGAVGRHGPDRLRALGVTLASWPAQ